MRSYFSLKNSSTRSFPVVLLLSFSPVWRSRRVTNLSLAGARNASTSREPVPKFVPVQCIGVYHFCPQGDLLLKSKILETYRSGLIACAPLSPQFCRRLSLQLKVLSYIGSSSRQGGVSKKVTSSQAWCRSARVSESEERELRSSLGAKNSASRLSSCTDSAGVIAFCWEGESHTFGGFFLSWKTQKQRRNCSTFFVRSRSKKCSLCATNKRCRHYEAFVVGLFFGGGGGEGGRLIICVLSAHRRRPRRMVHV